MGGDIPIPLKPCFFFFGGIRGSQDVTYIHFLNGGMPRCLALLIFAFLVESMSCPCSKMVNMSMLPGSFPSRATKMLGNGRFVTIRYLSEVR